MVFFSKNAQKSLFRFRSDWSCRSPAGRPASSDFWKEPLVLNFLVFDPLLSRLLSVSCRFFFCLFVSFFSRRLVFGTQKGQTSGISYVDFKTLDKFESSCKARYFSSALSSTSMFNRVVTSLNFSLRWFPMFHLDQAFLFTFSVRNKCFCFQLSQLETKSAKRCMHIINRHALGYGGSLCSMPCRTLFACYTTHIVFNRQLLRPQE